MGGAVPCTTEELDNLRRYVSGEDVSPPPLYRLLLTIDLLSDECQRHRRANLVRAVLGGADPEWIDDLIGSEQFDAVPWRIAERAIARTASEDVR